MARADATALSMPKRQWGLHFPGPNLIELASVFFLFLSWRVYLLAEPQNTTRETGYLAALELENMSADVFI
jgi:hypothetical protein